MDSLAAGAIAEVSDPPYRIHTLGVVPMQCSAKLRPISNMRYSNAYMVSPAFRMESVSDFAASAEPDDVVVSLDMAHGYYHVSYTRVRDGKSDLSGGVNNTRLSYSRLG